MAEQRRRWSPEFKRDAVSLVRTSKRPVAEIARELGVVMNTDGRDVIARRRGAPG